MLMRSIPVKYLALLISMAMVCAAQTRFESGEFKGFTKSSQEHIIVRIDEPFRVSSVHGVLTSKTGNPAPLEGAIFEVRGPGNKAKIWSANADRKGHFHIRRLPPQLWCLARVRHHFARHHFARVAIRSG